MLPKTFGDLFIPPNSRLGLFLNYYWVGNDSSRIYINNWSGVHFFTGILLGILLRSHSFPLTFGIAFIVHTLWELFQWNIENTPHTPRGQWDIWIDTLLTLLGVSLAHSFYTFRKKSFSFSKRT